RGYWEGKPEETFVLEVTHDGSDVKRELVKQICKAYAARFKQKCVYRAHIIMEGSMDDYLVASASSAMSKVPPINGQPLQPTDVFVVVPPAEDEATALLRAARSSAKSGPAILP